MITQQTAGVVGREQERRSETGEQFLELLGRAGRGGHRVGCEVRTRRCQTMCVVEQPSHGGLGKIEGQPFGEPRARALRLESGGDERVGPVFPKVCSDDTPIAARCRAQRVEYGTLVGEHGKLVDLVHPCAAWPVEPEGSSVQTGGEQHDLANALIRRDVGQPVVEIPVANDVQGRAVRRGRPQCAAVEEREADLSGERAGKWIRQQPGFPVGLERPRRRGHERGGADALHRSPRRFAQLAGPRSSITRPPRGVTIRGRPRPRRW